MTVEEPVFEIPKREYVPDIPKIAKSARCLPVSGRAAKLQAHQIQKQGHKGAATGRALKVDTQTANRLAMAGCAIAEAERHALTEAECLLVRTLALESLRIYGNSGCRMAMAPDVSWRAGKSSGWAAATVRKRLCAEDAPANLQLVRKAGGCNGHMELTELGWTVALAMLTDAEIQAVQPKEDK